MKFTTLGSGSSGNCYLIENKSECLMIEAGIDFGTVKKAIEFDVGKICGCLISHEHKDHSKYVNEAVNLAVDIYTSEGTINALKLSGHRVNIVKALRKYSIGSFTVVPFSVAHDAASPLGFLIRHEEMGALLFATDTYYIKNKFEDVNHIVVECNYSEEILDRNVNAGEIPWTLRNRILSSHMSLNSCIEFLNSNDLSKVSNIILIHLSRQNGDGKEFRSAVIAATGKPVYIARPGMELDIDNDAFRV